MFESINQSLIKFVCTDGVVYGPIHLSIYSITLRNMLESAPLKDDEMIEITLNYTKDCVLNFLIFSRYINVLDYIKYLKSFGYTPNKYLQILKDVFEVANYFEYISEDDIEYWFEQFEEFLSNLGVEFDEDLKDYDWDGFKKLCEKYLNENLDEKYKINILANEINSELEKMKDLIDGKIRKIKIQYSNEYFDISRVKIDFIMIPYSMNKPDYEYLKNIKETFPTAMKELNDDSNFSTNAIKWMKFYIDKLKLNKPKLTTQEIDDLLSRDVHFDVFPPEIK